MPVDLLAQPQAPQDLLPHEPVDLLAKQSVDFTAMAQGPSAQIPLSKGNPIQSKSLAGDIAGSFVTQAGQGIADLAGAPYAIASAAEAAGRDLKPGVPIRFIADPAFQPEAPKPTGPNFLQKLGAAGKEAFAGGNELAQATQGVFEPSGKHPIAAGVAGAVGGMIPAIATGNPLAAAGVIGAQSTGGSFIEYRNTLRKQGMADADAERLAGYGAVATGTLNGLSSVLPMSIVFRKAPGLRGMVARTIESAIAGGSQADLNLILTNAMKVSTSIDPKALENMTGQQLIDAFVTGGIVMGAFGALPHGVEPVKDRRTPRSQAYKAGQNQAETISSPASETHRVGQESPASESLSQQAGTPSTDAARQSTLTDQTQNGTAQNLLARPGAAPTGSALRDKLAVPSQKSTTPTKTPPAQASAPPSETPLKSNAAVKGAKEPWQMTRDEFANAFWFHGQGKGHPAFGGPEITGGITRDFNHAADYAKSGGIIRLVRDSSLPKGTRDEIQDYIKDYGQPPQHIGGMGTVPAKAHGEPLPASIKDPHRYLVEQALSEGKPVPSEVLSEYPDLKTPEQQGNKPTALGIGKPVGTEQQLEAMGAAGPGVSGPPARHSQILSGLLGAAKDTAHFVGDSLTGQSAPHTARASEESANRLVQYASSAIAAPHIAADFEAQILGDRVKDTEFSNKIGAVLTEDNLRSVRDEFAKAGDAEAAAKVGSLIGSYFKDEAAYQAALKDPEVQAAAQRVKDIFNPWMDETFRITQNIPVEDELSSRGQTTGARINLKVLDPQAVQDQQMRVGGGSGNLQNPLKRKSRFGAKAKGTAQQYDVNLGEIIKNTVADRVEKTNRNLLYEQLKNDGLAIEAKPGERFSDADGNSSSVAFIDGKPARKLEIKRAGGGPGMTSVTNLWIRPDVYGEVRKALAVDETFRNAGLARLGNILTHAQIAGPTDAVFHLSNIFSAITASPGGKTLLGELGRKIPGVNLIDTTARLVTNALRVAKDSPEIRAELAEIAKIGALRGESQGKYTAKLIAIVDRAGRIAMNRMYDNLVERGLADKGEAGRREFINQVGQYNDRLHGRIMSMLKQVGASPFVVAGKTFNRLGLKQLVGGYGVKPTSRLAGVQLRLTQAFGGAMALIVVPALMNYLIGGNINGRPGTPFGAIDTGKDDSDGKHIVVDPAKWTGLRRGMRISGLDATINGVRTGQSGGRTRDTAIRDALNGFLHPYAGPLVNAAVTVGTGHAFSLGNKQDAPTVQPGKSQFAENAKTALANLNPTVRSIVDARKQGKSAVGSAGAAGFNLLGAAGIKSVSEPSATTKATNMISEIMRRNSPSDRTPDEIASSKLRHQLADKLRAGQDISSEGRAAIQAGTITIKQLAETYKAAKQDPYTAMFKSLSLKNAQQVYDLGTPSEQAQWGRILSEKRLRDSVGNLEAKEKLKQKLTPIEQTTLRRNKNKLAEMERQDKARKKR